MNVSLSADGKQTHAYACMHADIYSIPGAAGIILNLIVASNQYKYQDSVVNARASGLSHMAVIWGPFFFRVKKNRPLHYVVLELVTLCGGVTRRYFIGSCYIGWIL